MNHFKKMTCFVAGILTASVIALPVYAAEDTGEAFYWAANGKVNISGHTENAASDRVTAVLYSGDEITKDSIKYVEQVKISDTGDYEMDFTYRGTDITALKLAMNIGGDNADDTVKSATLEDVMYTVSPRLHKDGDDVKAYVSFYNPFELDGDYNAVFAFYKEGRMVNVKMSETAKVPVGSKQQVDFGVIVPEGEWDTVKAMVWGPDIVPLTPAVEMDEDDFKAVQAFSADSIDKNAEPIKISCLGDSITAGFGSAIGAYHHYFKDDILCEVQNVGQSGSKISSYRGKGTNMETTNASFTERYTKLASDADVVTVLGGVNDCNKIKDLEPADEDAAVAEYLGTINDTTDTTFYGGVRTLVEALIAKYPNKSTRIVFFTPIQSGREMSVAHLGKYAQAIKDVCAEYPRITVIDLYNSPEVNFVDNFVNGEQFEDEYKSYTFNNDNLHPNDTGYEIMGRFIIDQLEKYDVININR